MNHFPVNSALVTRYIITTPWGKLTYLPHNPSVAPLDQLQLQAAVVVPAINGSQRVLPYIHWCHSMSLKRHLSHGLCFMWFRKKTQWLYYTTFASYWQYMCMNYAEVIFHYVTNDHCYVPSVWTYLELNTSDHLMDLESWHIRGVYLEWCMTMLVYHFSLRELALQWCDQLFPWMTPQGKENFSIKVSLVLQLQKDKEHWILYSACQLIVLLCKIMK